jgi:Big-like domain-containing protein
MFTLRRPAVYVPLLLAMVVVVVGAMTLVSGGGAHRLLAAGNANCPPVARNDAAFTKPSVPITVDVLRNDSDVDGDHLEFEVMNVSAGTAEVDFKAGSEALVYTPSTPVGTTATIKYRVKDPSGDVSIANLTVAITNADALPAGLESASPNSRNGDIIEARCMKAAKATATTATTATTTPFAATNQIASDATVSPGTTSKKSASSTTTRPGAVHTDPGPSSDTGGTHTTPTTSHSTTTQATAGDDDPPCYDGPSCNDYANSKRSTTTTAG